MTTEPDEPGPPREPERSGGHGASDGVRARVAMGLLAAAPFILFALLWALDRIVR